MHELRHGSYGVCHMNNTIEAFVLTFWGQGWDKGLAAQIEYCDSQ